MDTHRGAEPIRLKDTGHDTSTTHTDNELMDGQRAGRARRGGEFVDESELEHSPIAQDKATLGAWILAEKALSFLL